MLAAEPELFETWSAQTLSNAISIQPRSKITKDCPNGGGWETLTQLGPTLQDEVLECDTVVRIEL